MPLNSSSDEVKLSFEVTKCATASSRLPCHCKDPFLVVTAMSVYAAHCIANARLKEIFVKPDLSYMGLHICCSESGGMQGRSHVLPGTVLQVTVACYTHSRPTASNE